MVCRPIGLVVELLYLKTQIKFLIRVSNIQNNFDVRTYVFFQKAAETALVFLTNIWALIEKNDYFQVLQSLTSKKFHIFF